MKECFFVYAGRESGKLHLFYVIDSLEMNDGRLIKGNRQWRLEKKSFKYCSIGCILPAIITDQNQVRYNPGIRPVAYWSNQNDLVEWRTMDRAVQTTERIKREGQKDYLTEILAPVKKAYTNADVDERRAILAEVIRIITTYSF